MSLDVLLLNPERSRRYRGIRANVLRAAYGTDHYRQKSRSFRGPESALRGLIRLSPWELAERRWERSFYDGGGSPPEVIAQSLYMKSEIIGTYHLPGERVHVIHNAVDTREFSPDVRRSRRTAARARMAIPEGAFCLLFAGHNFRLKGLWKILDALAGPGANENAHLLVVGRGTGPGQQSEAASRIRRSGLGDRVRMAGESASILDAYAAADALLHLTWHDSFGFVVLEAMACGLPVVTTKYAGASELIDDGSSGLIVEPDDASGIAGAIRLLTDPATRARMGDAAAATARVHDEPENFAAVLRVFEIALSRSSGPVR
jgi:UDP-glucose:(heptosyl)LPS alpha-1,3-glucosyltransferase